MSLSGELLMKFKYLFLLSILSQVSLADDTEIYGATAIDPDNRVNSNVLFVMDTSGSMDGTVTTAQTDYNPSTVYSGGYNASHFYDNIYESYNDGIPLTSLSTNSDYECSDTIAALTNEGRVLGGVYQQYRRRNGKWGWRNVQDANTGTVRCDKGNSKSFYTGNYLNWYHSTTHVTSTRLDVVRDVVKDLTRSLSNINLGLMRFDRYSDGGIVDVPVEDITTSAEKIRSKLDDYEADGGTPLSEAMYEAALYYRGDEWDFGSSATPNNSVPDSRTQDSGGSPTNKYKTPIAADCQKNHIILLTDGQPTSDQDANYKIQQLISEMSLPTGLSKSCTGQGQCMDELAYWLKNTDQSDDIIGSQPVTTYTIGGFNLADGVELLRRTASWGGGQYYAADNTDELVDALDSIFLDILSTDSTFTAPAVSVNAFNASEHRDELYYALFRPDDNAKWKGNLKRYRIDSDGYVRDRDEKLAVSNATGFFNDGVSDFWNPTDAEPDGKDVTKGGMANLLTSPSTRIVYSEDSSNFLLPFTSVVTAETLDMLSETADQVTTVRNWIMGQDVDDLDGDSNTTENRNAIGDPLHSEPVVITYGGTDDDPDSTIFFGTNEGFIHAIDTETGREEFAFLPRELHNTQKIFYDNTTAAGDRPYGMDGPITTWIKDVNKNNLILDDDGVEDGEHVFIYAGMRRGGSNYYALDVTNRSRPSLLFKITGGTGDFARLGQTWSRMTVAKVKYAGVSRHVALFTGGYDTNQDSNSLPEADTTGNAIYMVDATTGQRLWWASSDSANLNISDMVNSFPSSISAVDINGDQHVDYFFAADAGGRIFRFDINQENTGESNFAIGGKIASIAGNNAANNRRFYSRPNISLLKDSQYGDSLTISIGSGHRAAPISNNDVTDRFYVINDPYPYSAPPLPEGASATDFASRYSQYDRTESASAVSTSTVASDKLYDATGIMMGTLELTDAIKSNFNVMGGWYVTLPNNGEKVLSESTTFAGAVLFTTFSPSDENRTSCGADTGTSRSYALNQRWPTAVIDLDNNGSISSSDVSKVLAHSGIAPRPVVIYRQGGGKSIAIGTETIDDDRFKTDPPPPCPEGETCEDDDDIKQCESANCYVIPVYWRQNTN